VKLFFGFLHFVKRTNIRGSVRSMLDRCMESNNSPSSAQLKALQLDFESRLETAAQIFGDAHVFRYKDDRSYMS
jgi:hypothetical protein